MMEEGNEKQSEKKSMISTKQKIGLIISVLLVIGLIAFVFQNSNKIKIEFFMLEFRIRIIYIILVSMLTGALGMYTFSKYRKSRKQRK